MTPSNKVAVEADNRRLCHGARIFPERFLIKLLRSFTQTPARPPTDHREPAAS